MNITDIITAKTLTLNELQQNKQIGYEKDGKISKIDPKFLPDMVTTDEEIANALAGKADVEHSHDEYAKNEDVSNMLADKADAEHSHAEYATYDSVINLSTKFETELNKRPIAYASMKGELNWEFSGNINDYENVVLESSEEYITLIAIKVLDIAPSAEERELINYTTHSALLPPGGTPSINETNGRWSPFYGDERAYVVFQDSSSEVPMIAAVYSAISEGGMSFTPGLWVMQVQLNGENTTGVQTLHAPSVTLSGVKMSADLIDAEWMATNTFQDLDIVINEDTIYDFETISIEETTNIVKFSDVIPTKEQVLNGGKLILNLPDGSTEEVLFTNDNIYQDEEFESFGAYIICDMFAVFYTNAMGLGTGIYCSTDADQQRILELINENFGASSITLRIPNIIQTPNTLPDKFLPDTVVQVYRKKIYAPLTIEWDGEIGDREYVYEAYDERQSIGYAKVSDLTPSMAELIQSTVNVSSDLTVQMSLESAQITEQDGGVIFTTSYKGSTFPCLILVTDFNKFQHESFTFPSNGLYFLKVVAGLISIYTSKIHIPSCLQEFTKKIDPELIDGEIPYRKVVTDELKIKFDGNVDGYENVQGDSGYFVKLSDMVPTLKELEDGSAKMYNAGDIVEISFTGMVHDVTTEGIPAYFIQDGLFVCVSETFEFEGIGIISSGIWAMCVPNAMYPTEFYLPSVKQTIVKKLDGNMVDLDWSPQIKGYNDTVMFERTGVTEAIIEEHSYTNIAKAGNYKIVTTINGVAYINTPLVYRDNLVFIGNAYELVPGHPNTGEPYLITITSDNLHLSITEENYPADVKIAIRTPIVDKLPEMYLPDFIIDNIIEETDLNAMLQEVLQ